MGKYLTKAVMMKRIIERMHDKDGKEIAPTRIALELKIPVTKVVAAVSDPTFKANLLDYRLKRGLQTFEMIGDLKEYLHSYVKAMMSVVELDPEWFKKRLANPKIEPHKEIKGLVEVIRIATDINYKELRKLMQEADEAEDPALADAKRKLAETRKNGGPKKFVPIPLDVTPHYTPQEMEEVPHGTDYGDTLGQERTDSGDAGNPVAGAAEDHRTDPDDGANQSIEPGQPEESDGNEREVPSYLLEE